MVSAILNAGLGAMAGPSGSARLEPFSLAQGIAAPGTAWVAISLASNGILTSSIGQGGNYPAGAVNTSRAPQWVNHASAITQVGNTYEGRLDVLTGISPNGGSSSVGVWVGLEVGLLWIFQRTFSAIGGTSTADWQISIRPRGAGASDTDAYAILVQGFPP